MSSLFRFYDGISALLRSNQSFTTKPREGLRLPQAPEALLLKFKIIGSRRRFIVNIIYHQASWKGRSRMIAHVPVKDEIHSSAHH